MIQIVLTSAEYLEELERYERHLGNVDLRTFFKRRGCRVVDAIQIRSLFRRAVGSNEAETSK